MLKVSKCDVYSYNHASSYDAQNKMIKQFNFPYTYYKKDKIDSVYHDRMPVEVDELIKPSPRGQFLENFITTSSNEELDVWMRQVAKAAGFGNQLTGWRIVRFSNIGGYPSYRYDFYYTENKNAKLYSDNSAPNVNRPNFKKFEGAVIYNI